MRYPGMLDLAGLKDDIAVRQDNSAAKAGKTLQQVEGAWKQPIGEGGVHEKSRHGQKLTIAGVLGRVARLRDQILQDPPITLASGNAKGTLEMVFEVLLDRVVV